METKYIFHVEYVKRVFVELGDLTTVYYINSNFGAPCDYILNLPAKILALLS